MDVVGTDGGLLDRPYPVTELLLSPGERADLLVLANRKSGTWRWLSLPYSRGGMSALQQVTLMTVTYGGAKRTQSLPAVVNPAAVAGGDGHLHAAAQADPAPDGDGRRGDQRDHLRRPRALLVRPIR